MAKGKTSDALQILQRRLVEGNPELQTALQEARLGAQIARQIRQLRKERGLTQGQLAELMGTTTTSGVSRLEDEDYEGYTLATLQKVAQALGTELRVEFVDRSLAA